MNVRQAVEAICVRYVKYFAALIYLSLLASPPVYADFNKALDAYVARDGKTLLEEVKDAVDKKNNDGLLLFLGAMDGDSAASEYNSTTHRTDSTLREILSKPQWNELRGLLAQATESSTVEVQYDFRSASQFYQDFFREAINQNSDKITADGAADIEERPLTNAEFSEAKKKIMNEYIQRGSKHAMLQSDDIFVRAEAGDPLSQLKLGLKYLNAKSDLGCGLTTPDPLCKARDEAKGYVWLKRAVKSYELSPKDDIDVLSFEMCQVLRENANGDHEALRQAYLWALVGMDFTVHESRSCLGRMHLAGELKGVDPVLDAEFGKPVGDQERLEALSHARPLPAWIVDARNEIATLDLPVFTSYSRSIFEDGRVMDMNQEKVLMRVSPDTVKAFLAELKSIGFYDWSLLNYDGLPFYFCFDNFSRCNVTHLQVTARNGKDVKRFLFETQEVFKPKFVITQRMAQLVLLIDKYFPDSRSSYDSCSFAKSEVWKQACKKPRLEYWHKILEEK
jgi:TPR repeat protein